jgi:hypothetical protein
LWVGEVRGKKKEKEISTSYRGFCEVIKCVIDFADRGTCLDQSGEWCSVGRKGFEYCAIYVRKDEG